MKTTSPCISVVALSVLLVSCLADLRPDGGLPADSGELGRTLLKKMADAHGGRDAWLAQKNVSLSMSDRWTGFFFLVASPWDDNPQHFQTDFIPGQTIGRLSFSDGDMQGTAWGLQNWLTYHVVDGNQAVFAENDEARFWVPTTLYFPEAPFRLVEGSIVRRLESAEANGKSFERVFITWNGEEPSEATDQYVAWIDSETSHLAYLQYTVRDFGGFITGCMSFSNYETFDGFMLAKTMQVVDEPGGDAALHRFEILDAKFNVEREKSFFYPSPNLKASKY